MSRHLPGCLGGTPQHATLCTTRCVSCLVELVLRIMAGDWLQGFRLESHALLPMLCNLSPHAGSWTTHIIPTDLMIGTAPSQVDHPQTSYSKPGPRKKKFSGREASNGLPASLACFASISMSSEAENFSEPSCSLFLAQQPHGRIVVRPCAYIINRTVMGDRWWWIALYVSNLSLIIHYHSLFHWIWACQCLFQHVSKRNQVMECREIAGG